MKFKRSGVAGALLTVCLPLSAFAGADPVIPEAYGHADAWAQGVEQSEGPAGSEPSFSYDVSAVRNPLNRTPADASAAARAHGQSFGPFGVYASVAAHAANPEPDSPQNVAASASSANYVQYLVSSETRSAGEAVRARLTLHFKGTMEMIDGNPADPDESGLIAYIFTDTQVGHNGGQMDIIHEGGADFYPDDQFGWGDFDGDGTFTDDGAGRHTAAFDFTDIVEFDTTVGSSIELSFNLWAEAKADLPLNMSAIIDFSEGTTYALAAADSNDAQFVAVVPEPAAISLFGIAALTALSRRRR